MVEERREIVTDDYGNTAESQVVSPPTTVPVDRQVVTERSRVVEEPAPRIVEQPAPTYVQRRDPIGNSIAAGSLIQTVVWAVVVIVLLVVGILVLVHYNII